MFLEILTGIEKEEKISLVRFLRLFFIQKIEINL